MKSWLRGKAGGAIAFLLIAALVAGGLGWVTAAALRLEQEQLEARARAELQGRLQLALSLLDSRVRPALAREDGRPYNCYSAVYAPSTAVGSDGTPLAPGGVLEPSPLLGAELLDWMLLHFQVDEESGWGSPQVLAPSLRRRLEGPRLNTALGNATAERAQLLAEMQACLPARTLLAATRERAAQPTLRDLTIVPAPGQAENSLSNNDVPAQQNVDPGFRRRAEQQSKVQKEGQAPNYKDAPEVAYGNLARNGGDWFASGNKKPRHGEPVEVVLSPMTPLWLTGEDGEDRLLFARVVHIGDREVCQGVVLDWRRLQGLLAGEVSDLFPEARIVPVHGDTTDDPEGSLRAMTALPLQLDPGPGALVVPKAGFTPLRVGLSLAWAAALLALLAVGLGGWSLLDLSERRIRFVSAVTHELRTPLTTLRLYLDMLTGGLVRDPGQREEYLQTLHAEADRLNRLIGNVLDFSRLENQRPRLAKADVPVAGLLEEVRSTWRRHCEEAGKELLVENALPEEAVICTDGRLVQQILGNLIDNACKYSREAADGRVWLRARTGLSASLEFEVEDRGPGVPARERRAVFRAFRRGRHADVTCGGVGLGLALARRWAHLLGGSLTLHGGADGIGACFRLRLR
jgi:signal transduction histidine kinase